MQQKINRAQRAIHQLQIRVDTKSSLDKQQLTQIIVDYLDYPDSLKAKKHAIANQLGNFDLFSIRSQLAKDLDKNQKAVVQSEMICDCCGMFIHTDSIPYCTPLSSINVGLGARLYFNSLLYNALIFFIASVLFSVYYIITNSIVCHNKGNDNCQIQGLSLGSKIQNPNDNSDYFFTSSILGIILVSIWGIIQIIKNHHQNKIDIQLTNRFIQASQFTVMVEDFPSSLLKPNYQDNLQYIQHLFNQYKTLLQTQTNFKIQKINIARNLYLQRQINKQRIQYLNLKLKEKQQIFKDWLIQRRYHNRFFNTMKQRDLKKQQYLNFFCTQYDVTQIYQGYNDQSVIMFITFQQSKARQQVQYNARQPNILNFFNIFHKNHFPIHDLTFKQAPPPEQIKWTNIGFPLKSKLKRIILVYGVAILFLAASLGITYGLNKVQIDNPNIWISIIISIVITTINFAIQFIIMILSKYLNQITQSNIQFNIAFKICVFQILNVIGVPLIALYSSQRSLYGQSGRNGLSQDIFFIALFNILPPLGRFVDPFYIYIKLRNKIYSNPSNYISMADYRLNNFRNQQQFNKIFQDNDFDLGYQYAYIIKTSFFTAFFMSLQPIITIFAVIGLLLMFFVNKYRILYRFFKPRYYSSTVNNLVNYLLNLSPMVFGLGMLTFVNWQKNSFFSGNIYLNWAIFIIGGFFFLFPFRILYKCIPQPKFQAIKYSQKRAILQSQYDRMNPVTKSQALDEHKNYLKQLQAAHILPQQARLLQTSVIRGSDNLRKSRLALNDQLRDTIKNHRNSYGKSQKAIQVDKDLEYGIEQNPTYNENINSYNYFVNNGHLRTTI